MKTTNKTEAQVTGSNRNGREVTYTFTNVDRTGSNVTGWRAGRCWVIARTKVWGMRGPATLTLLWDVTEVEFYDGE